MDRLSDIWKYFSLFMIMASGIYLIFTSLTFAGYCTEPISTPCIAGVIILILGVFLIVSGMVLVLEKV